MLDAPQNESTAVQYKLLSSHKSNSDNEQINTAITIQQSQGVELNNGASSNSKNDSISDLQLKSKNNIVGMFFVLMSVFILLSADAIFKYTSSHYKISLLQCIIISNITQHSIAWILWLIPSSITKKSEDNVSWFGEKDSRLNIWIRGVLYWCDLYFYWKGITLIPIGDAEAIYFLCPIFVAFGARVILKEEFSKTFPVVFIFTIIGIIILCQPAWITNIFENTNSNSGYFQAADIDIWGVIFLIFGCIAWGCMNIIVRKTPKAHWIQLELTTSLQSFAIWTPILVFVNKVLLMHSDISLDNNGEWVFSIDLLWIVLIGVLSVIGLMFLVLGYQYGEATKVSWMEYMNVPIGYIYQWVLFNEIPNIYETIGALIMMSTCAIEMIEEYYNYKKEME